MTIHQVTKRLYNWASILEEDTLEQARRTSEMPRLAAAVEALLAMEQRLTDHVVQLAAERDTLVVENAKHRDDLHEWETEGAHAWVAERERQLSEVRAERDALRELVDSMTVEWGIRADGDDEPYTDIYPSLSAMGDEFDGSLARENEHVVKRRAPGPWTVVEGDDQ